MINDPDAALVALKARRRSTSMGLRPGAVPEADQRRALQRAQREARGPRRQLHVHRLERAALDLPGQARAPGALVPGRQEEHLRQGHARPGRPGRVADLSASGPSTTRSSTPWPFDPAKAKALLAEAGWTDTDGDGVLDHDDSRASASPLRFEIISNSGNEDRKNLGLVVIDEFKRAGIDASFRARRLVDPARAGEALRLRRRDPRLDLERRARRPTCTRSGTRRRRSRAARTTSRSRTRRSTAARPSTATEFDPAKRKVMYRPDPGDPLRASSPTRSCTRRSRSTAYDQRFHGRDLVPDRREQRSGVVGAERSSRSTTDERRAARATPRGASRCSCRRSSRSRSSASRSCTSRRATRSSSYLSGGLASGQAGISTQKLADVAAREGRAAPRARPRSPDPGAVRRLARRASRAATSAAASRTASRSGTRSASACRSRSAIDLIALFIAYLVAVPLGIYSAVRPGTRFDQVSTVRDLRALLAAELLARRAADRVLLRRRLLRVVPARRAALAATTSDDWSLLPARRRSRCTTWRCRCSSRRSGSYTELSRFLRSSMLENARQDFIRTARAKGVPERTVILKHMLRNSLIPMVMILGGHPARADRRLGDHREHLLDPGARPARLPGRARARLPGGARAVREQLGRSRCSASSSRTCARRWSTRASASRGERRERREPRARGARVWRELLRRRRAVFGLWVIGALAVLALAADLIANDKPYYMKLDGESYFPIAIDYGVWLGAAPVAAARS